MVYEKVHNIVNFWGSATILNRYKVKNTRLDSFFKLFEVTTKSHTCGVNYLNGTYHFT